MFAKENCQCVIELFSVSGEYIIFGYNKIIELSDTLKRSYTMIK